MVSIMWLKNEKKFLISGVATKFELCRLVVVGGFLNLKRTLKVVFES
jgi:hypothetical protein